MWKQTIGDWQERRHRRSGPVPSTPQANLPESVASTEHGVRGFLPRGFHDRVPLSAYPTSDGAASRQDVAPPPRQAASRALTETWVAVTGATPDDVLDVRNFFDTNVGRTVSHYLPPPSRVRSDTVYIQFASSLQAAQAVRSSTYTTRVECGVAAIGVKAVIDAPSAAAHPHHYLELVVSWCTDCIFLEEREKLRRQLLESAAPSPLLQHTASTRRAGAARQSVESDTASTASLSLPSSARGSEPLATSGAASTTHDSETDHAAAHPLLPRHRGGPQQSPSPWSSPVNITTTTSSPSPPSPFTNAGANPPVQNPAAYYQAGGAYRYEDSFFSDGLQSSNRDGRQRVTVLSLFFHPCSASYGLLYSLCLYQPLRLLLLLLWTLCNAAGQLLPTSASAACKQQGPRKAAALVLPPISRWRQRRSLCMSDVVPASASPVERVAFLFYKYMPFTPDPEEVDVALWSWLALRSPYPRRSLNVLKQSLLVRQRSTELMVGQLRPGRESDGVGMSEVNQFERFGNVAILGGEPYTSRERQQQLERSRELPVLLRWRPAWWFSRYSSFSLAVLTLLVCCHYWYSME